MRKYDLLNIASDLRRAARWAWGNQAEKYELIKNTYEESKNDQLVKKILKESKVYFDENIFKDEKTRLWFADQSLMASIKLMHYAQSL